METFTGGNAGSSQGVVEDARVWLAGSDLAGEKDALKTGGNAEILQDGGKPAVEIGENEEPVRIAELVQGGEGVLVQFPNAGLGKVGVQLGKEGIEPLIWQRGSRDRRKGAGDQSPPPGASSSAGARHRGGGGEA
nr:hypothetical protein [Verrucomicrobium spinosum]